MRLSKAIVLLSAFLLVGAFLMVPAMTTAQDSEQIAWSDTAMVPLSPDQVPSLATPIPEDQNPQGVAIIQMNESAEQVCFQLWVSDISNVTVAHIHQGAPGEEGPPVAWLFPSNKSEQASANPNETKMPGNFTGLLAMGSISAADLVGPMEGKNLSDMISAAKSGQLYVNVHTTQNPVGEIRGQITSSNIWTSSLGMPMTPVEEPELNYTDPSWNISGLMPTSSVDESLVGRDLGPVPMGAAVVQKNGSMIHYALWTFNIANVTQAHFHMGAMGAAGPVVAWLYPSSDATAPANLTPEQVGVPMNGKLIEGNVSEDQLMGPLENMTMDDLLGEMANGSIYINVHTTQNPAGEIRGQIDPANMTCGAAAAAPSPGSTPTPSPSPTYVM